VLEFLFEVELLLASLGAPAIGDDQEECRRCEYRSPGDHGMRSLAKPRRGELG